ncbi:MAG TPA: prefoldin subunit alpha [Nitrososphaerales archaeon]
MSKQPTEEEAANNLLVEIRVLESTYNELTGRQNILERALLESRAALEAIKGLSGHQPTEVLTQLGGGALLRSQPPSADQVLISIGANVVIEKPKDEAVAILEERSREFEKTIMSIIGQRNEIAERLNSDREIMNNYVAAHQQE